MGPNQVIKTVPGGAESDDHTQATLHDVVGNDDHVVALLHFSFEHEGEMLQGNESWVSHMKDGQVTETWVFIWDQDDADQFWSKARPQ